MNLIKHILGREPGSPDLQPCQTWQDDEIGVRFPSVLAGNRLFSRRIYEEKESGYSLRYGPGPEVLFGPSPHFDLYVFGDDASPVPDGFTRELVAQMSRTVTDIGLPTVSTEAHFPDSLTYGTLERTGIPFVGISGSFRAAKSRILFGTTAVLFPYRGKFIKIRYSEPRRDKTPATWEETFALFESRIFEPVESMEDRINRFMDSLDGLLFGALKRIRPDLPAYYRLGVSPAASDDDVIQALHRKSRELLIPDPRGERDVRSFLRIAGKLERAYEEIRKARGLVGFDKVLPLHWELIRRLREEHDAHSDFE